MKVKILNLPESVEVFCEKEGSSVSDIFQPDENGEISFEIENGLYDIYGILPDENDAVREPIFSTKVEQENGKVKSWLGHNRVWGTFGFNCLIIKMEDQE